MNATTVNENDYKYSFPRPALGVAFRANNAPRAVFGAGIFDTLQSSVGSEIIELDTGWEGGLRFFVVPSGATRLELVEAGDKYHCDLVRFVA